MASITSFWNNHKEIILGAIILPLVGFFISLTISKTQFSWEMVLCILAIVALVIFASLFIVYIMHSKEQEKKNVGCWRAIELLEKFNPNLVHQSLTTYQGLKDIEKDSQNNSEIFIFSSEFRLDEDENFKEEVIFKNFDKNVKYTYFIPNDDVITDTFKNIVSEWIKSKPTIKTNSLITAYKVDPKLVYMTICIYNATNQNREVLVKFPSGNYDESKYPFIFRLANDDRTQKEKFYNALRKHINDDSKLFLWA